MADHITDHITIRGARLHNLKNITLTIPKNQLVVLTGLSGSGKSTLGFDILHKEGQRQYLEALGMVPFGLAKPPVDTITGLSPTISVDQHLTNRSPRSTVGTATDVYTYLRVLFARLGHRPCPTCGKDVPPALRRGRRRMGERRRRRTTMAAPEETFPCPHCGAPVPEISMAHFSFNKPEGACPTCTGLGSVHAGPHQPAGGRAQEHPGGRRRRAGIPVTSTITPPSCGPPRRTTASPSTSRCRSRTTRRRSATCCSSAWTARAFAATSPRSSRRPPSARGASRASPPACCAATPNTSARTPARPTTATSWKTSWSPRPAPTARARACAPKAGP